MAGWVEPLYTLRHPRVRQRARARLRPTVALLRAEGLDDETIAEVARAAFANLIAGDAKADPSFGPHAQETMWAALCRALDYVLAGA